MNLFHSKPLMMTFLAMAMGAPGMCRAQQVTGIELQELKATLEASARQIGELQNQLAAQKAQSQVLTQSLAAANAEATTTRESYEKLRGLLEGLGIGALEGNTNQVQERLLSALSDMRLLDDQKKRLTDALLGLTEAAMNYSKVTPSADQDTSKKLDGALTQAEAVIRTANATGTSDAPALDLHNAKVVSLKPEMNVAVLNVGSKDGVKVGMPFSVYREDRPIAKLLVVDVRKSVAGAVVQEMSNAKDPIQVGDRGIIDADRSF